MLDESIKKELVELIKTTIKDSIISNIPVNAESENKKLLSTEDAARLMNVSVSTIYNKLRSGELKPYGQTGRKYVFTEEQIYEYMTNAYKYLN